ncbi:hypothetical protein Tco_0525080 [Tanacetum coccineum]
MSTLAEFMILFGGDNCLPMLEKHLYDSWKSRMELYMKNIEHGRMILKSVEHGPLIWPTIEENGVTRRAQIRRIFLDGYGVLDVRTIFFIFLRLSSRMRAF